MHAGQLLANNCYSVHAYSSEECCSIVAIIPLGVVPSIQKLLTSNRFRRNVVDDEARTLETLMRLLVQGKRDSEISAEMHISVDAVRWHIKELFSKTGYNNRVALACDVINKDLIVPGF